MALEDFRTLSHISPALTNEYMSKALTEWFKKDMEFTHWEYVGETGKGDSYLSELIRIKIFGKDEADKSNYVQVILKNIPKSISRRTTFRCDEFFKNEITFYQQVLPILLKFQSKKNIPDPFVNIPNLFAAYFDGNNDYIILEDASTEQFGPAIRQKGIDMAHCHITLKTFAKFHAISFAMRDQEPEEFKKIAALLTEGYYQRKIYSWYTKFWDRICGIAIDAVEKEYPNSIYVEKIKKFAVPVCYWRLCDAVKDTYDKGVISHGDSWTNNFLYKYPEDAKVPVDSIMLDFQLSRCASPVLDISFFIYACTTQDLREKYYDELIKYYYQQLSKQIKALGSDPDEIYSWNMFLDEVKKYSYFGLAFSFEAVPFIILDPEDAVNMEMEGDEKINIDDVWKMQPIKTKEGRLREADNIVHAVDRGYI